MTVSQFYGPLNHLIRTAAILVFVAVLFSSIAQAQIENRKTFSARTMGPIEYAVTVVDAPANLSDEELDKTIKDSLERVNQLMSTYIADSDVSRFNQSESTDWIAVDAETARVVDRALKISSITDGAFDVTVGPLVSLWKFGAGAKSADGIQVITKDQLPTEAEIAEVQSNVGFEKLSVRSDPPAIRKTVSELKLDLSAIAKGYAVDRVSNQLAELGCENVLVIVGGEAMATGLSHPNKSESTETRWTLGIEKPIDHVQTADSAAALENRAMATSGDYRSFFMVEGTRYSHAIDPQSGRPAEHQVASATVVAGDCMTADALATALMVCGPEKAKAICRATNSQYLIAVRDPSGYSGFRYERSETFPAVALQRKPASPSAETQDSIWPALIGAIVVFGLAIAGMAVGAIFNNKPVQGSCGGLSAMKGESECGVCSQPTTDCVEAETAEA